VVATPLPACVDHPLVATAATGDEFDAAVTEALALRSDPAFAAAAARAALDASWERRVELIREALRQRGALLVPA